MYSIKRQGSKWYVFQSWYVVFAGETKAECLAWIEEAKVSA